MALFGRKKEPVPPAQDETQPTAAEVPPAPAVRAIERRSAEAHREFLLGRVHPLRPFGMQIWDVHGLTLCEDIVSDLDLPLVTTTRVAGFAVRGSDLVGATPGKPRQLYVVDSIGEGDDPGPALVAGAAVEVAEGAIVPEGVDAVVPRGDGRLANHFVRISREVHLHENLRRAGSELADGTPLLASGEVLTPRAVAVLAEIGLDKVLVRPRARVVVFTVGESLVTPGQPLTNPRQRYDSATSLLTAAARADGATVYPLGIVESYAETVRQTLADQQIRADLILVVGGGDTVREVVRGMGELDEAEVAINRPTRYGFASVGPERVPLVLLPSGVVSAYVGYQAFVRPLLHRLNDTEPAAAQRVRATVPEELAATEGITEYLPAVLADDGTVRPVAGAESELAFDLARANALMIVPEHWGGVAAGSVVECVRLDDGQPAVRTGEW